jgi:hypothetical protein
MYLNSYTHILICFIFCSAILFLASTKVKGIEMLGKKCVNEERNKGETLKFSPGISLH